MDAADKHADDKTPPTPPSRRGSQSAAYKQPSAGGTNWKGHAKDKRSKERSENDSRFDSDHGSTEYSRSSFSSTDALKLKSQKSRRKAKDKIDDTAAMPTPTNGSAVIPAAALPACLLEPSGAKLTTVLFHTTEQPTSTRTILHDRHLRSPRQRKTAAFAFRAVVFTAIVVVIVIAAILLRHRDAATTVVSKDFNSTEANEDLGETTSHSARTTATGSAESRNQFVRTSATGSVETTNVAVGNATEVPGTSTPEVITTTGKLKGGSVDVYGVRLHRWLGVPYAHFESGGKRFPSAQPAVKASSHVALDATEWSPPCAQLVNDTLLGREDCLRVNVWEPVSAAKKPLLLAMTQDWFSRGSNNLPEWEQLAAKAGAVVMSPNVRLGVLGFLGRTSPEELDADLAIRDAMVAVHWALKNAAAFHADPARLMLVGHGSGAYVLTAAVQAMKLRCMRAVLEGPVVGSVLPTNTDTINTWIKLASVLGCRGDNESELKPCVQDAELPDLLEAAASVTFRFMPRWDTSKRLVKPAAFQVQEVIAGVDVDEIWAFFREHVKPWAVASGCAVTVVGLYHCTLEYLFTNGTSAYRNLLHAFEPKNESDIVGLLAMFMSGCDTHRIAQGAQKAGYHYITEGSGKTLFEPLLDVEALAAFLKDGSVRTRNGISTWRPVTSTEEATHVVLANGTDVMDSRPISQACQDAFFAN
ncbi:uncharacterized protein [Dermacentor albipictus]|uniref:uncharacterized protein isoform X2 n=1 Tax=Dermacentor albipictus TaxID=60249 RepID=UPI0031FD69BB